MPKGSWREFDHDSSLSRPDSKDEKVLRKDRKVRIEKVKGGRGGKIVTVISGLGLEVKELRVFLKTLKTVCGTGGTIKGDLLELQGDQVLKVLDSLKSEGFSPKRIGG